MEQAQEMQSVSVKGQPQDWAKLNSQVALDWYGRRSVPPANGSAQPSSGSKRHCVSRPLQY